MKLLPQIRIQGVTYTIKLVPDMRADMECSGRARTIHGVIELHEGMCPDMLNATQIHEIFEVFNMEHELGLTHQQIQSLATSWYSVINDNPELFENYE